LAEVNKVIRRCPAIILAANRIARVKGRIILLIVSITTIKGINIVGVPLGIKWINKFEVLLNQPYNITADHKGRAIVSVVDMCLDLVKIKGSNPGTLLNIININNLTGRISVCGFFLIRGLNSEKI
jgi:hypothetical protein